MPNEAEIYQVDAERYQRLIAREDWQGNIQPALRTALPSPCRNILDLGAGTGRFERLLAHTGIPITALDRSVPMLKVALRDLRQHPNIAYAQADHRALPIRSASFDAVLSGWSFCYLVTWHPNTWQRELACALAEIQRVLRPGGRIILLETLGTGVAEPQPPEHLAKYYQYLDNRGYTSSWIRTDYRFASAAEAHELVPFFFGEAMLERLYGVDLPECTGIWTGEGFDV